MSLFLLDVERLHDDKEYRKELRHRCETDGFFLAPFLGYHDFSPRIHGPVADLYVKKNREIRIEDQDPIKFRMHLDPRHTFKTTWGFIDTVQWIITQPNITIVNETATQALGKLLTQRISKAFYQPKTKEPTPFQVLFPEYIVNKNKGDYRAPCATIENVEPTLYSTSVGSSQSGYHPYIINPDDMVDTENSGIDASDDSRERVWNTYSTNLNTLRTGGYVNIRGTRYHPQDLYGRLLQIMNYEEWKTLIRSSLTVRLKDRWGNPKRLIEGEFPDEADVDLNFEELLNYRKLRGIFKGDYRSFMCQQQNDPQGGGVSFFPPERYQQAQIDGDRVPSIGETKVCWRLPCATKPFMKYAEGVAVKFIGARVYLVDAWRGIYTPTELYERIIDSLKRHHCGDLVIENTPGSDSEIPHILNEAARRNWSARIERPDFENDDTVRGKRLQGLEPMMQSGRFWISKDSGQDEEVKRQFTNFGLIEQNGVVDCASRLALRVPASVLQNEITAERRAMFQSAKEAGVFGMIYGQGGMVQVEEAIVADQYDKAQQSNSYGLTPMLGGLDG